MDFQVGSIRQALGVWGGAVLLGSMGFTELFKRAAKKAKADVPWYTWMIMPSCLAIVGVIGMVVGGILEAKMALLVWFVVSFAGPLIYAYIIKPTLSKFKREGV